MMEWARTRQIAAPHPIRVDLGYPRRVLTRASIAACIVVALLGAGNAFADTGSVCVGTGVLAVQTLPAEVPAAIGPVMTTNCATR